MKLQMFLEVRGIKYMIRDAKKVPLRFWFGAPSCVPATNFETNGAILNHIAVRKLFRTTGNKISW